MAQSQEKKMKRKGEEENKRDGMPKEGKREGRKKEIWNWKIVKEALHWIVWHSRNLPALVTTLLTLYTLLYYIFKARATCIPIPCIRYLWKIYIYALTCTNIGRSGGDFENGPGGRLPAKSSLWKGPYLQSSYMRLLVFPVLFILREDTYRYRCVPELLVCRFCSKTMWTE